MHDELREDDAEAGQSDDADDDAGTGTGAGNTERVAGAVDESFAQVTPCDVDACRSAQGGDRKTGERADQRGSQFAKRAALMEEWAVYCATVPTDAVVKPIRGAA